jgi:transposase
VARYGRAFKDRAVAPLLPPENTPVETLSREIGVSVDTVERWGYTKDKHPHRHLEGLAKAA